MVRQSDNGGAVTGGMVSHLLLSTTYDMVHTYALRLGVGYQGSGMGSDAGEDDIVNTAYSAGITLFSWAIETMLVLT